MKLWLQQNDWTCGICTYAMCMDVVPDRLVELIGHDGGRVIDPNGADITKRVAGFTTSELNLAAWKLGYAAVEIFTKPAYQNGVLVPGFSTTDALLEQFDRGQRMALLVQSTRFEGSWHYVAYVNGHFHCHDPVRGVIPISDLPACCTITTFAKRVA